MSAEFVGHQRLSGIATPVALEVDRNVPNGLGNRLLFVEA